MQCNHYPSSYKISLTFIILLILSVVVTIGECKPSLTRTLEELLTAAEVRENARELSRQRCGDAIDQDDPHTLFSSFIDRGNEFTNSLISSLSGFGGSQMKDYRYELIDNTPPFMNSAGVAIVMVFVTTGIIIIIASLMFPSLCSPWWRSIMGKAFFGYCCHDRVRVHPIQSVAVWKRRFLFWSSIVGITLFLLIVAVSILFSFKLGTSSSNVMCQASRFGVEIEDGIQYNQESDESQWLSGLNEGSTFKGFSRADDMINQLKDGESKKVLEATLAGLPVSINPIKDRATSALDILMGSEDTTAYLYRPQRLAAENGPELIGLLEAGQTSLDLLQKGVLKEYGEVVNPVVDEAAAWYAKVHTQITNFNMKLDELVEVSPLSWMFIPYAVYSTLLVVGVVMLLVVVALLFKDYKSETEPNPQLSARLFGFLWGWFAITGALAFCCGFLSLIMLSTSDSSCQTVKGFAADPSTLLNYATTQNYYAEDPNNPMRYSVDSCFADNGNGGLLHPLVKEKFSQSINPLQSINIKFSEDVALEPKDRSTYEPHLTNLLNLKAANVFHASSIPALDLGHLFMLPEIVFSGSQSEAFDIEPDTSVKGLQENMELSSSAIRDSVKRYVSDWFTDDATAVCVKQYDTKPPKVFGMKDHLTALSFAASQLAANEPLHCARLSVWQFCAPASGSLVCSDIGNYPVNVPELEEDQVVMPLWSTNKKLEYTYRMQVGRDDDDLKDCFATVKEWSMKIPTCQKYYMNSLVAGMWLASWKVQHEDEALNDVFETVGSMLTPFDEASNPAKEKMDGFVEDFQKPLQSASSDLNCKALGYSFGSIVDGVCNGVQRDMYWVAVCFCFLAAISFFFWVICYKVFHYFKNHSIEGREPSLYGDLAKVACVARTPSELLAFTKLGDVRAVEYYVQNAVAREAKDQNNNTALHCAAFSGNTKAVQALLDADAKQEKNDFGYTPLAIAASQGHADVVSLLIKHGADLTVTDGFGDTALHAATRAGDMDIVQVLCQDGAPEPTYLNDEGVAAADIAAVRGMVDVETFLGNKSPNRPKRNIAFETTEEEPEASEALESPKAPLLPSGN